MNLKQYGNTAQEQVAGDSTRAREVVLEIMDFGVNDQQIMKICYFLIMELEDQTIIDNMSEQIKAYIDRLSEKSEDGIITDMGEL
jgi:hypothetical protein